MTTAERIPVAGTYNFRRMGGDAMSHAGLFRSDALHRLGRAGRRTVRELGITTVIDLRSTFDRRIGGRDRLRGTGATRISVPISGGSPSDDLSALTLIGVYRTILTAEAPAVAEAIRIIAHSTGPVLVHCTAGKDRTGLVSALVLRMAGVSVDDVVADYAETEALLAGEWSARTVRRVRLFRVQLTPALVEVLTASPPAVMAHTLAWLDEEYGGVEQYLRSIGLTEDECAALRRRTASA